MSWETLLHFSKNSLNEADFLFQRDTLEGVIVPESAFSGYDECGEETYLVPGYFRDEVWTAREIRAKGWKFWSD